VTRRRLRTLGGIAGVLVVTFAALLALRGDVRHWVRWEFGSHAGTPAEATTLRPLADDPGPALRLAVAGDVGTGDTYEWATATRIDALESERAFDALILLGDDIYPDGDPNQVDQAVFEPFAGVLDGGTELLAVLGNHDVAGHQAEEVAAALGMPGRWYARRLDDLLLVVLDSTQPDNAEQRTWLESTLSGNTAPWVIVALHHPPYSAGYHGSDLANRKAFTPLFDRYGVDLVLAGHDHDYQRSIPVNGVTYVVTGAAAKLRDTGTADFTSAAVSTRSFVDVAIWPDHIQLRAVDQDGRQFDEVTLSP
jgi:predicted phosphodiesterase